MSRRATRADAGNQGDPGRLSLDDGDRRRDPRQLCRTRHTPVRRAGSSRPDGSWCRPHDPADDDDWSGAWARGRLPLRQDGIGRRVTTCAITGPVCVACAAGAELSRHPVTPRRGALPTVGRDAGGRSPGPPRSCSDGRLSRCSQSGQAVDTGPHGRAGYIAGRCRRLGAVPACAR